jgi:isoleucyl-tRNA synthetase
VLSVVPAALGPRLGPRTQQVINAVRRGEWTRRGDGSIEAAGEVLLPDEYTLRLRPLDEAAGRVLPGDAGVVVLDLAVTAELKREGIARDVARIVQQARKDADLQVTDRIEVVVEAPGDIVSAVGEHEERFREQTLTTSLWLVGAGDAAGPPVFAAEFEHDYTLPDGRVVTVRLRRWREEPAAGRD